MARALYAAPFNPEHAAQVASLRARIAELEAEVEALRASVGTDLDAEFAQVTRAADDVVPV